MKQLPARPLTRFFSVVAILLFVCDARAQGVNSSGTDFWLGFIPLMGIGTQSPELLIASATSNTVQITVIGGGSTTFTMAPNSTLTFPLSYYAVTHVPETVSDAGVHLTSTAPISVYGVNAWDGGRGSLGSGSDGFLALPTPMLGTRYFSVNYYDASYLQLHTVGEFVVIATQDSTFIQFTTTAHTRNGSDSLSHKIGETWSTMLMRGQTYLVQSSGRYTGVEDLTGSRIVSSKPIAVISGHEMAAIDTTMHSANPLIEMILPVDRWGTKYFELPMTGRTQCGDYVRVLSGEDGNVISYNSKHVSLNAGEWAEIPTDTTPTYFSSDNYKKFLTIQYAYSSGFNGDAGLGDPFMTLMTPFESFEKRMLFCCPVSQKNSFTNYLTVIAPRDSIATVKLNGTSLSAFHNAGQVDFSGSVPQMSAWRVIVPGSPNSYLATANVQFGMYLYGVSNYDGYGWPSGMSLRITSPDTLAPTQDSIADCGNYRVTLHDSRRTPKFSFNDSHIAEVDLITEPNDERWGTASFNYAFTLDPRFTPGDSTASFSLLVIDSSKDAYAAIYISDIAGNSTVYQYFFTAPKFTLFPAAVAPFLPVVIGQDSCRAITITNAQSSGKLSVSNVHLAGSAVGRFTIVAGPPVDLNPGESTMINMCFIPDDTAKLFRDTLIFETNCPLQRIALSGVGITPLINAEDVDFGVVDSGFSKCLSLKISNPGKATLTITQDQFPNTPDFTVSAPSGYPIVLKPGDSILLNACFHPSHSGKFISVDHFTTTNAVKYLHSLKDSAILTGRTSKASVDPTIARDFAIDPPVPNPFTSVTTLPITLPRASRITVTVASEIGVETVLLPEHSLDAGRHLLSIDLSRYSAGAYEVRVFSNGTLVGSERIVKLTK